MSTALDLFAGPGGWSVACAALGVDELGVEWDAAACATATAAGHRRVLGDVREFEPLQPFDGLIASPPCQTFSQAGKGEGLSLLNRLCHAVALVAHGWAPAHAIDDASDVLFDDDRPGVDDVRSSLVLEPMRLVRVLRPTWVALEQVPAVMPIWSAYAVQLRRMGYHAAVGMLRAEQYGVPQTRRRAILVAHHDRPVAMPRPTHSRYHHADRGRLDDDVLPWVSMADALGWQYAASVVRSNHGTGGDARARGERAGTSPAATVTSKVGRNMWTSGDDVPVDMLSAGRVNDQSGTARDAEWPSKRPATTVAGRDLIADPGANSNRFNGSTKSRNDGVRVDVPEAAVLQGFPPDYPWQGTRSQQYQQIGDAIPPPLAAAILRGLL